jgi:hypothetical protein
LSLFTRLIIRLFQLVFSAGIIFFSHNESANSIFQPAYQTNRTGPMTHVSVLLWDLQELKKSNHGLPPVIHTSMIAGLQPSNA